MTALVNVRSFPLVDGRRQIPADVVYIGREVPRLGLRRSPWFNPYRIGKVERIHNRSGDYNRRLDRETAIDLYRLLLDKRLHEEPDYLEPLRGRTLACWCPPLDCHGDAIIWALELRRPLPKEGEPIVFGVHAMPEADAEAPAWPVSESKISATIRRAAGLPR